MSIPCKLAPLGGFRLPTGYTELEYLESSGTQRIDINYQPTESTGYYTDYENTSAQLYQHVLTSAADGKILLFTPHYNGAAYRFFAAMACADETFTWNIADVELLARKKATFNYLNTHICEINGQHKFDVPTSPLNEYQEATTCLFMHPASVHQNEGLVGKLFAARITEGKQQVRDLVPVLDENGTPCMFDKVSPQCFYNTGKGTFGYRIKRTGHEETVALMSLRDPYYVPPSGVYARVNGENVDIVADTENPDGEGWEWFANTGEAYAHFGIEPQEEEFLTE